MTPPRLYTKTLLALTSERGHALVQEEDFYFQKFALQPQEGILLSPLLLFLLNLVFNFSLLGEPNECD